MSQHFKLIENSPNQIVFKEKNSKFIGIIFGLVGLPMLFVGLYLWLTAYQEESSMSLGMILTGAGLAFSSIVLIFTMRDKNPSKIVFNHADGGVEISSGRNSAWIPYKDLEGFGIRTWQSSSSSSSGGSRSRTYYQVYWKKKDGGFWDLSYFSSPKKAEALKELMTEAVDLQQESSKEFKPTLPLSVQRKLVRGHETFEWKNALEVSGLMGIFVATGFLLVGIGWLSVDESAENSSPIIAIIFILFSAAVLIAILYGIIDGSRTTHMLRITPSNLECIRVKGGNEKIVSEVPLNQIKSIHFNLDKTHGGTMLQISTEEDWEQLQSMELKQDFRLQDIGKLISMARSAKLIKMPSVGAVERIHFESILQQAIQKKRGREVL